MIEETKPGKNDRHFIDDIFKWIASIKLFHFVSDLSEISQNIHLTKKHPTSDSDIGLAPNRRQTINWNKDGSGIIIMKCWMKLLPKRQWCTFEVWKWINNFITDFIMDVITYSF